MWRHHLHATPLRELPLLAGASLATFFSFHVEERSGTAKIAVGLLSTAAAVVLAQRLGADVRASFASGQPELAGHVVRTVLSRRADG
jgi:hypothetical protein